MGQLNISRITSTQSIITPPQNVDGIYNDGGTFYQINNLGEIQPINALKQIAVTISQVELFNLATTPKVIIPAAGNDTTNVVVAGFIDLTVINAFSPTPLPILELFEGGGEETFFNNGLLNGSSGLFRFIEKHDPQVGTASTHTKNNQITLTAQGTFSSGTGSAVVYLSYTQFNDNLIL